MAKTTRPLTNTEIKNARPREKEYNLSDGNGLQLRIKPNGSRLWLLNYSRPHTKKRANMSLGAYPDVSLARARELTRAARELLAQNIDPLEERDEKLRSLQELHANTFEHIVLKWFEVKKHSITPAHAEDTLRSFKLHLFPDLGRLPLHKLKATHAIKVLEPIAAKGSLETVKRLCQRINEVMIYAVNTGIVDSNPLAGINKAFQAPIKKHMPTLRPEQLPEFMKTLHSASIKKVTRCLIEWQLHTMVRPSEAAGTRWDEIDFTKKIWNIPAERMKKNRPHSVPLTDQALALLDAMTPISGNRPYVFPADRDRNKHTNAQTANMALKRMGYGGQLVSHGLRALASTTLNEQQFSSDVIESALAHSDSNEIRAAYNRADYLMQRRIMMEWWSNHIDQAATGKLSAASVRSLHVINS